MFRVKSLRSTGAAGAAALVLSVALAGCARETGAAPGSSPASAASAASDIPDVLATVGGEPITMAHVQQRIGDQLDQMETQYRRARHTAVETTLTELIREQVLLAEAQKQGVTMESLVLAEAGGSLEPTDVEIGAWYDQNRDRVSGRALDQLKPQIADLLRTERRTEALTRLEERLNRERQVVVNLQPYRLEFPARDWVPSLGPASAPVTLVEFSDFECPFCARFAPTLHQLAAHYGDRLRIEYRQFPIPSLHPNAMKAAEAALCANEQGKFWELHDMMFQEQGRLTVRDLKEKAGRLGVDQKKFDACMDGGRYVEAVQEDVRDGSRVGVNGTPAVFVNGIALEGGAVPFETAVKAIDRELARAQ